MYCRKIQWIDGFHSPARTQTNYEVKVSFYGENSTKDPWTRIFTSDAHILLSNVSTYLISTIEHLSLLSHSLLHPVSKLSTTIPNRLDTAPISSRSFDTHRIPSYISIDTIKYLNTYSTLSAPPSTTTRTYPHSSFDLLGAQFPKYLHIQCITWPLSSSSNQNHTPRASY